MTDAVIAAAVPSCVGCLLLLAQLVELADQDALGRALR